MNEDINNAMKESIRLMNERKFIEAGWCLYLAVGGKEVDRDAYFAGANVVFTHFVMAMKTKGVLKRAMVVKRMMDASSTELTEWLKQHAAKP